MTGGRARLPLESVEQRLAHQWHRFGFFQAVRLLVRQARRRGLPASAEAPDAAVSFATPASLAFPPAELAGLQPLDGADAAGGPLARMTVNFFGLTGPQGVLPRHYTVLAMERQRERDPATQDFLDLFNHRLLTLFWRAWAKYRPWVALELEQRGDGDDFLLRLLCLVGMGSPGLQGRLLHGGRGLADEALAYYGGILGRRPLSAQGMGQVLGDLLGLPVRVQALQGHWMRLPPALQCRPSSAGVRLGEDSVLGSRVWDRQSRLGLVLGPLGRQAFEALLPTGTHHLALVEMLRFMTGIAMELRIELVLRKEEVPIATLGHPRSPPRLGWNAWIASGALRRDARECVFLFSAHGGR